MTVQATHGQLLLDVLNELHALRVDLAGSFNFEPILMSLYI